jgi:hypothetical protein
MWSGPDNSRSRETGGRAMNERDVLADLRAWRDEFARSHKYDLGAMAATLRALDRAAGARLVSGEPRKPEPAAVAMKDLGQPTLGHRT